LDLVFRLIVRRHPEVGTILRVDLSEGFRPPEMVKRRPAIVFSPPIPGRPFLCSIVPLSTTEPRPAMAHHLLLTVEPPLPHPYASPRMWVKGDVVLTVAFHRLRYLHRRSGEDRIPDIRVLDADTMARVKECVRSGLGLTA
jgi:mRNA interferase MazF